MLVDGALSAGHCPAPWLTARDPVGTCHSALSTTISLSVRPGRNAGATARGGVAKLEGTSSSTPRPEKDADTLALEKMLVQRHGRQTWPFNHKSRGGEIFALPTSLWRQLDELCRRLQTRLISGDGTSSTRKPSRRIVRRCGRQRNRLLQRF